MGKKTEEMTESKEKTCTNCDNRYPSDGKLYSCSLPLEHKECFRFEFWVKKAVKEE